MKSSNDIEKVLERLGSEWPNDRSIVDRVMHEIESTPVVAVSRNRRSIMMRSLIGLAASVAAFALLWWGLLGDRNSLYAQVMDAAHKARTIHITYFAQTGKDEPGKIWESWYESGVGFRRDEWDWGYNLEHKASRHCTTCLGNRDGVWTLAKDRHNTVMRSRGKGIAKETEQIFTAIDQSARGLQNNVQRYPEGDQTFDGQPRQAYMDRSALSSKTAKRRELYYLDQQSRLVRVVRQERDGDGWSTTQLSTIAYDEPLGAAFFQPNYGKDFKIVDADAQPARPEPAKPEGPALTYQIDPDSKHADTPVDMDRLLKVVDLRLNGGAERLAVVRKLDDRRIEVTLMRRHDADRQRVERQLTRPGTLEFRILANKKVDRPLIDRARKEPARTELLDSSGKRLAWWVPVKAGLERQIARPESVGRTKKAGNREVTEVLVVADPCNVTGHYLKEVKLQFDPFGKPGVSFTFNDAGGRLFGKLTGDHIADDSTGLSYSLGIIIDGELLSAPMIRSKIGETGQITGSFTEIEVSDMAAALNAGSLPAPLRLVAEPRRSD
jgi:hypothetical protein